MEKFIAYVCMTAIALLCYGLALTFYTLETKKADCIAEWDENTCQPWRHSR